MKNFIIRHWKVILVAFTILIGVGTLFFLPCPNRRAPGEELMTIADTDIVPCRDVCGFPAVTIIAILSLPFIAISSLFQ